MSEGYTIPGHELRDELESLLSEEKTLKAELRTRVYADAGIPDAAHDLIDAVYDGDMEPDQLREFAESKGLRLEAPPGLPDPIAEARAEGESRLASLGRGALAARPAMDDNEKIARAEAAGDWQTVSRLNVEKLHRARQGRPEYQPRTSQNYGTPSDAPDFYPPPPPQGVPDNR